MAQPKVMPALRVVLLVAILKVMVVVTEDVAVAQVHVLEVVLAVQELAPIAAKVHVIPDVPVVLVVAKGHVRVRVSEATTSIPAL